MQKVAETSLFAYFETDFEYLKSQAGSFCIFSKHLCYSAMTHSSGVRVSASNFTPTFIPRHPFGFLYDLN